MKKSKLCRMSIPNLVKQRIIESKPVEGSLEFLSQYHNVFDFAIISGSDQEELIEICQSSWNTSLFHRNTGSPFKQGGKF